MRNRFEADRKKTSQKKNKKTNNKVLVLFFFSLFCLGEEAHPPTPILFFSLQNKTSLSLQVHTGWFVTATHWILARANRELEQNNVLVPRWVFTVKMKPSAGKKTPPKKPNPALIVSIFSHLSISYSSHHFCCCHNLILTDAQTERREKKKSFMLEFGNVWDFRAEILAVLT